MENRPLHHLSPSFHNKKESDFKKHEIKIGQTEDCGVITRVKAAFRNGIVYILSEEKIMPNSPFYF